MQKFSWILQISRPRFWFYLIGPLLLGIAAYPLIGFSLTNGNFQASLIAAALFFTLPANLLIYGLNDLFDYETDKHNHKKKSYETMLEPSQRRNFLILLSVIIVPILLVLITFLLFDILFTNGVTVQFSPNVVALLALAGFFFFGVGYSAPPIRAKARPFMDTFFNILYIFPALVAYGILTEQFPPLSIVVAATLWCMAMHAFSAIPDISADKKARLQTVATVLGSTKTLLFCLMCYALCMFLTLPYLGLWAIAGFVVYATMLYLGYSAKDDGTFFKVYKIFPYVNVAFGFVLFWLIIGISRNLI